MFTPRLIIVLETGFPIANRNSCRPQSGYCSLCILNAGLGTYFSAANDGIKYLKALHITKCFLSNYRN